MITFVDSSNSGIYGARFAKATLLLQSYDEMSSDSAISTLEEYFESTITTDGLSVDIIFSMRAVGIFRSNGV